MMGNAKIIPENRKAYFLPYQAAWSADDNRLKLMEKARQIGISLTTGYKVTERTAAQDARYDQWVSSRDDLQARLFLEDCKFFANMLKVAAEDMGQIVIDEKQGISAYVLHFANGHRIHSLSSHPDAQAGKRGGRVLDEFALNPKSRELWAIAYPGITWGGTLEVISTHRGSQSFFNQIIREIRERGNPKKISLHRVTLEDALNQGFLWKLQQHLAPDDDIQGMNESQYFDFVKSGCADEESFRQEYMCDPADDDSAFLEYDLIASCEYGMRVDNWGPEELERPEGQLFAGVDIGRKHDLTVIWVLEKLGDVLYTRNITCLKNMSKPDQEKILWPIMQYMNRTCIDNTGLGIGWTDDAEKKFGKYRIEGITFTGRAKEEMAYPLRGAFEDKKIRIPYDPEVRADLRSITKQTTTSGNIRFTAERSKDGHADRFWALALAIHAAGSGTSGIPRIQSAGNPNINRQYYDRPEMSGYLE